MIKGVMKSKYVRPHYVTMSWKVIVNSHISQTSSSSAYEEISFDRDRQITPHLSSNLVVCYDARKIFL